MTTLIASWPPGVLSPNSRAHWRAKMKPKREQRTEGMALALTVPVERRAEIQAQERIPVALEFCPPDRRPRDAANLMANCKALLDGLADGLGVNDRRFRITFELADETVRGGCVKVRL